MNKIRACDISVDGKKYKNNHIDIGTNLMFIRYSSPKYNGRIMIDLNNPDETVSNILIHSDSKVVEFNWTGLWEDETNMWKERTG